MKTANEYLELRNKKMEEWLKFDEQVKGQWSLIETNADKYNLGRNSKYIDIGNVGELYKANINRLVKLGYKIVVTKNGTRLYFDETDYNDYVNSNKNSIKDSKEQSNKLKSKIENCNDRYKEALKKLNDDIYSSKETNLKNDLNNQEKDNNKVEAKEYDTFEDFATDMWNNIFNKYNL